MKFFCFWNGIIYYNVGKYEPWVDDLTKKYEIRRCDKRVCKCVHRVFRAISKESRRYKTLRRRRALCSTYVLKGNTQRSDIF